MGGALVGGLAGGEAGAVNAVVHPLVDEVGKLGLFGGDVVREKLRVARGEPAEGAVEHPADVVLGVVDDPARFLVPEDGDGDAAVKSRIGRAVGLGEEFEAVDRIVAVARAVAEGPTALVAHRIDHGHADDVFQPLQMPDDDRATSPRAGERNVEVITICLGWIGCRAVRGNPVAKPVLLAVEFSGV